MKKQIAWILSVLLLTSMLFGCGAATETVRDAVSGSAAEAPEYSMKNESLADSAGSTAAPQLQNQKLVRKIWLEAETDNMDPLLEDIDSRIAELSGYVEKRQVRNGSTYSDRRYRHAEITIRVPVAQLDAFVEHVSENANITYTNETAEDITLTYVATESRVKALETEQTRLLELLAQAETMDDLLTIEERLTDVRAELEEYASQLRLYDNMVDYGTLYLTITEVTEFTVVEEEPPTIWERIGKGFVKSLKNVWTILQELFVFFIVAAPYLIIPAFIAGVIVVLIRLKIRSNRKKREKEQNHPQQ